MWNSRTTLGLCPSQRQKSWIGMPRSASSVERVYRRFRNGFTKSLMPAASMIHFIGTPILIAPGFVAEDDPARGLGPPRHQFPQGRGDLGKERHVPHPGPMSLPGLRAVETDEILLPVDVLPPEPHDPHPPHASEAGQAEDGPPFGARTGGEHPGRLLPAVRNRCRASFRISCMSFFASMSTTDFPMRAACTAATMPPLVPP